MIRMSLHEVGEVARRAAASGAKVRGGGPTVQKVADALGLPHTEVEAFLDQARQSGTKPIRDFKVVLALLSIVAAFMLGVGSAKLGDRRETTANAGVATEAAPSGYPPRGYAMPVPATRSTESVSPNALGNVVVSRVDPVAFAPGTTSTTLDAKTTIGDAHHKLEGSGRHGSHFVRNDDADASGLMAAAEFSETKVH